MATECHQCHAKAGSRKGPCRVCYSKKVAYCATCAMWELGPLEGTSDPFAPVQTPTVLNVQRQARTKSDRDVSTHDRPVWTCKAMLRKMGKVCPFFADQLTNADATLYGKSFKTYVCKALKTFERLYPECKYR